MSSERSKIIDKAKKLRELANRGIDGEKETAKRMYDAYKEKHNLTDEEVDGHEYTDEFFKEFANMNDEEMLEFIGKSLIVLGIGIIGSYLFSSFGNENNNNANNANQLNKIFSELKNKSNKNKNNNNKNTETKNDEINLTINRILDKEKEDEK